MRFLFWFSFSTCSLGRFCALARRPTFVRLAIAVAEVRIRRSSVWRSYASRPARIFRPSPATVTTNHRSPSRFHQLGPRWPPCQDCGQASPLLRIAQLLHRSFRRSTITATHIGIGRYRLNPGSGLRRTRLTRIALMRFHQLQNPTHPFRGHSYWQSACYCKLH